MFKGSGVAIVTPFCNEKVDFNALEKIMNMHNSAGIDMIIVGGTTGESVSLSIEELRDISVFVKEKKNDSTKLIIGVGKNYLDGSLKLLKMADDVNPDGVMIVCPYYNKPTQDGLYQYFKKISENSRFPIILYNVPGRTASNMNSDTAAKLFHDCENIIAVKEASGDLVQFSEIYQKTSGKVELLSGEDALNYPLMALGGSGVISVVANILPGLVKEMTDAVLDGNHSKGMELHHKLLEISRVLFLETNPIPVKTALVLMGVIKNEFRLPLCPMKADNIEILKDSLRKYELI